MRQEWRLVKDDNDGGAKTVYRTTRVSFKRFISISQWVGTLLLLFSAGNAFALTLQVNGPNAEAISAYRWLIEEDAMHAIVPGQTCGNGALQDCLSVDFHRSYMPVIGEGTELDAFPPLDPNKHYYLSVLPDSGYALGGAPIAPGQSTVNVVVNAQPIPTAQIRVLVFEDNAPINNVPELPREKGLQGFSVLLFDAGGRYGISGGHITVNAYGEPLGPNGDGVIPTDANGVATIKNLTPGKYGIQVVPPAGQGWSQTSTIEGTKTIDAWVKANEPPFFTEFGPPGPHVFVGFVRQFKNTAVLSGGARVTGQVRKIHNSRPPDFAFYTGTDAPGCWVGLNEAALAGSNGLYAAPCNADSTFEITGVPAGSYQLAVWDTNLDLIFANVPITVDADINGTPIDLDLVDVPVFTWFGQFKSSVFNDQNQNGFWDVGEAPLPEQVVNLRFRDGSLYQSIPTDLNGEAPFEEVFPFFSWIVAEVDYARFKATGATIVVDAGGPINPTDPWSMEGSLNPQPQSENANAPYRTELGPVLTQAIQTFAGQTNAIQWGKSFYGPGENGGISGIVYYAVTRAENDPEYAAAEPWEPGIARIQVALYHAEIGPDFQATGRIQDLNGDGLQTVADVDNFPFGWFGGSTVKGPEDYDWNGNGIFDSGDAIQIAYTDSWDDNRPSGCQGDAFLVDGLYATDCFDGLRNFNQVRPGVFDGGYAFNSYFPGGVAPGAVELDGIPAGYYIVGTGEHPGYKTVKEEDKNVDFGDTFFSLLLPPQCVGDTHVVPNQYSLFPLFDDAGNPVPPYLAGQSTPLCDRKQVLLTDGKNAAADFYMFTEVPIAGHVVGFILDNLANEFDPNAPNFGEKYAPPFMPVSIRDFTGREISRTYADRWGRFNALLPSTYTANVPSTSGMSPNMLITCMNDPGPITDPVSGQSITDPYYQRSYSQFCYTFQYMPGTTTYLDTPVVPVAAFAGPNQYPLDCEFSTGTPVIWSVSGPTSVGPYVNGPGEILTVTSAGSVEVPNPLYDPAAATPRTILRDYGFGNVKGQISIGGRRLAASDIISWNNDVITLLVPRAGQMLITRGDNAKVTTAGITIHTGGPAIQVPQGGSIQDAINVAQPGDVVLVPPGTYDELVVMWKPIKLQGSGASTVINAIKAPGEKLLAWRVFIDNLIAINPKVIDMLPSQEIQLALPEPTTLFTEEGPGIIVLAKNAPVANGGFGLDRFSQPNARIDGFSISGADVGGGVFVNGYANYLQITNNRIFGNFSTFGGGIRVGHPLLTLERAGTIYYDDGHNDHIGIRHNYIAQNGANGGYGGGISLNNGADFYEVTDNFVCGNFTQGGGGGIGHYGVNDNGLIEDNTVLFNQTFNQSTLAVSGGGGVFISGGLPLNGPTSITAGAGSTQLISNLIQGNMSGTGDGGGIGLFSVNGQDIAASPSRTRDWYRINVFNNMIVDNVAGLAAGGIAMEDAALVSIVNNTVANNDSTATARKAFDVGLNESTSQPAGVVGRQHSINLAAVFAATSAPIQARYGVFSNPELLNNILWHNRSFHFLIDTTQDPVVYRLTPNVGAGELPDYYDLDVLMTNNSIQTLDPQFSLLTDTFGYNANNISAAPGFVAEYVNGDRGQTLVQPEVGSSIQVGAGFDEGGNFIDIRFGPLSFTDPLTGLPIGNYSVGATSPAIDAGALEPVLLYPPLTVDIDNQRRPNPSTNAVDIGADEVYP